MINLIKIVLSLIVLLIAVSTINFWYTMYFIGAYYTSVGFFMMVLGAVLPFLVLGAALCVLVFIWKKDV